MSREVVNNFSARIDNSSHNQEADASSLGALSQTGPSIRESRVPQSSTPAPLIASVTGPGQVLLGTPVVLISDSSGQSQPVRLLVDCGSQLSLMTASCARRLGLIWLATTHRPPGAGQVHLPQVKGSLCCDIRSRIAPTLRIHAKAVVVTTITGDLPTSPLMIDLHCVLDHKSLADPGYGQPGPIDFLLGNDLFMSILTGPAKPLKKGLGALDTIFGLILMGSTADHAVESQTQCLSLIDDPISDELLTRFWELEQVEHPTSDPQQDECEDHFRRTHYRLPDGRYVVELPFKSGIEEASAALSKSRDLALVRFSNLVGKLNRYPTLRRKYSEFMKEYEDLGHMSEATTIPISVIPHHAVFRKGDTNANIRVVFDASMKTSVGSLNDWLLAGRKLQQDVADVIMSFRLHAVAVTTDLVKMYRQVLINPIHRRFQCIWWRSRSTDPLRLFELNTITYGETSSPFLAMRVLRQLTVDEGDAYLLAAKVLSEDVYVDDIVSGASTVSDAILLKDQLTALLSKGQFITHKWKTNSAEFMRYLGDCGGSSELPIGYEDNSIFFKILGMSWAPKEDAFLFQIESTNLTSPNEAYSPV